MPTIFLRENKHFLPEKMQIELQISAILDEFLVLVTETVEEATPWKYSPKTTRAPLNCLFSIPNETMFSLYDADIY